MIGLADRLFNENWDVHLYAIEHRYYDDGSADDNHDENQFDYTYLSSRQAVKDIVEFMDVEDAAASNTNNNTWILFGGSYPGMLSAWARLLHPETIHGAVANSAPVQPQLDFYQYYDHVALDLVDERVGGSEECKRIFVEAHEQVVAVFDEVNPLEEVATLFNVCGGADMLRASRRNMEAFVGDGLIRVPSQSNDPSFEGAEKISLNFVICNTIIEEHMSNPNHSSMEILANLKKIQNGLLCEEVDYNELIEFMTTRTDENANDLAWLYQTCNEFGFYQTCNVGSTCPYGRGFHLIERDLEFCQIVFGIDTVTQNVASSLEYYVGGSENTASNRIIFVNGDVDPWTELAVTETSNGDVENTVMVPGASHHFWTHEIKDTDDKAVVAARQAIYDTVSEWL
ncbi:serine protease, partial [Thalassiosira pseudonana CCMP1335]